MTENLNTPSISYRLQNLTKTFPGVLAVDRANMEVRNGEIHGIIGKNGAGKSVTVNMIAGVLKATSGSLWIGQQAVNTANYTPAYAHELRVSLIPQEPLFSPYLDVTDNIFLGIPIRRAFGLVDNQAMREKAAEIAQKLSVNVSPKQKMADLSLEDQQLLAFGKSLFVEEARVILLDEITASLPRRRKELLLTFLREFVKQRDHLSFTLITHHINEVIEFCDRVTVMRDGRVVATLNIADTTREELAALVVGAETSGSPAKTNGAGSKTDSAPAPSGQGETVLQVRGLTRHRAFSDVSFDLALGEVIGLAGLDGSGKDELLEVLAGLERHDRGTITLQNKTVKIASPGDAFSLGIAYLPRKREEQAVIHNRSVEDNTLICIYPQLRTRAGLIDHASARQIARQKVDELKVKTPSLNTNIDYLSGGNRQKVILNRISLTKPLIFLLNEPTRGVDLATKPEILIMVRQQLARASGVIVTSESEEELVEICDQILIFYRGKIQRILKRGEENFSVPEVYRAIQGIEHSTSNSSSL